MSRPQPLFGAGGGGKGGGGSQTSYAPTEAADSLRSKAFARVIDLVSEGEIYGPVDSKGRRLRNAEFGAVTRNGSGGITAVAIADGGAGYDNDIALTFTDATGITPTLCVAKCKVNSVGTITSVEISDAGANYTSAVAAKIVGAVGRAVNLDGVPLLDATWTPNFKDVTLDYRLGTQIQTPLTAFPSGESTTNYGLEFKKSGPISFVVDEPNASKAIIGVMIPQLYKQSRVADENGPAGSISGATVSYACYIRYTNENTEHAEELFFQETVTGKTASAYIRATEKTLPRDAGAEQHRWYFRMVRLSDDEVSVTVLNKTKLEFVTVLTTERLSFPLSAIFGVEVNAEQFRSVPVRSYDLKLLLIQVPSNYFPETRLYNRGVITKAVTGVSRSGDVATAVCPSHGFKDAQSVVIEGATQSAYNGSKTVTRIDANSFSYVVSGTPTTPATGTITAKNLISDPVLDGVTLLPASLAWDGLFYVAWTDNFAWCFYDLVMNRRYGTGEHAAGYYGGLDKWTTYLIGKICDEQVSDGYGSTEPRFACNLYLQTPEDAFKVLTDMASGFRAMLYWANGQIVPVQDSRKSALHHFTNASVKDGMFTYSGTGKKARHTVALVRYNDARDEFKPKPEYVDDLDGILRYGVQPLEITAFGCTSRAQAYRHGLMALMTERTNTETVTFQTGLEAGAIRPGDVFKVSDRHRSGLQYSGRVLSVSEDFATVRLDRAVELTPQAYTALFSSTQPFFTPLSTTAADTTGGLPTPYRLDGAESEAEASALRTAQIIEQAVLSAVPDTDGNLLLNFLHPLRRVVSVSAATSLERMATITAPDHGLFSEQKARLSGCNLAPFNGLFPVRVLSKDSFEIELLSLPSTPTPTTLPVLEVAVVQPGAVWGLECADAKAQLFRAMSIDAVEKNAYEVVGLEYHPEIFEAVDKLLDFDKEPPSALQQKILFPKAPVGLVATQSPITSGYRVSLDWQAPEGSLIASYYVYVRQGLNNFAFYTEVHDTQADIDFTVADDYSFRVVSVGPGGQTSQAAETELYVGDAPTTTAYDRVTGLELQGGAFETEFQTENAVFVWRANSQVNVVPLGSDDAQGAEPNSLPAGTTFEVAVYRPETEARIYPASGVRNIGADTTFSFTKELNAASVDASLTPPKQGPFREFIFEVRLCQTVNGVPVYSLPSRIRVSNSRPAVPQGITLSALQSPDKVVAAIAASVWLTPDLTKIYFWVTDHPGCNLSVIDPVELEASGQFATARNSLNAVVNVTAGHSYYVRYAAADAFSTDKLDTNVSAQFKVDV